MQSKEENRKVSIIIPVYNVEKYLELCLNSVLEQTYTDFEAILVDDGSTDRSAEICDRFVAYDGRIRVIHKKNGGPSQARNVGVQNAKGEYIFFLDSDDCIHPELLDRMVRLAEENNASLVQIDVQEVEPDFTDYRKALIHDDPVFKFSAIEALYNLEKDDKSIAQDIRLGSSVVWTKLYKRELFDVISFPEEIRLHEDQMVVHRFYVEAGGVVFYRAPLYYYRKHPNSLITEGWTPKRLTIFDCYEDRLLWAQKVDAEAAEKNELIYYVFIRYLTCMFKNFWMAEHKLTGKEKEECQNYIIARYRQVIKNKQCKLRFKHWMIYHFFSKFPHIFIFIYEKAKK